MLRTPHHPESLADRRADLRSICLIAAFSLATYVVEASSLQADFERNQLADPVSPWIWQGTSQLVLLVLLPFLPSALNRAPLQTGRFRRSIPLHVGFSVCFSVVHILGMVALRELLTPLLLGYDYNFGLSNPDNWFYEYRKDALTYAVIILIFSGTRVLEQRSLELSAARRDARQDGRLTLKSGGRTIFVRAADVVSAQAASNYVEIKTTDRTHLARMTLIELEALLRETGSAHIRVHRSHIVHREHIREITPTGDGNVSIEMSTGDFLPGSRSYRARLETVDVSLCGDREN